MLRIDREDGLRSKDLWGKDGFLPKPKADSVTFKLTKKHIKFDKANNKHIAPRSFFVRPNAEVVIPIDTSEKYEGETELRFYSRIQNKDNVNVYLPAYATEFGGRGELVLDVNRNSDLVFYLMHHPRCATSPFKDDKKSPFFYLEDKKKDAKINLDREKLKLQARSMVLLDEPDGLGEDKLRVIAASYNIPNSRTMDIGVLREGLLKIAEKKPQDFINSVSSPTTTKFAVIQKAIDKKIIRYNKKTTSWEALDEDGNSTHTICKVSLGAKPQDRLFDTITKTKPEIFEELKEMVEA